MNTTRPRILRLAARDGVLVPRSTDELVLEPEVPLLISFEGLTDDEQKKALAAFPGGQRFVLVRRAG